MEIYERAERRSAESDRREAARLRAEIEALMAKGLTLEQAREAIAEEAMRRHPALRKASTPA